MTAVVVVAQFAVALALLGFGLWARGVTAQSIRMLGSEEDRLRRARACRQGGIACLVAGALVALASVVTVTQVVQGRIG